MPPSVLEAAPARSKAEGAAKRKPHAAVRPIAANRRRVTAKTRRSTREKLSVLIPVYNERYTVASLIDQVMKTPLPVGMDRELIVVDDCSTDGTRDVLKRAARRYHGAVRLFEHAKNQGKGAAIRTAVAEATGSICLIQDADLEYDPADYRALLEPILNGDADVVYGSRFVSRDRRRVLNFWHSLGNRVLTTFSNFLTNLNLTDMETCYKAIRTDVLKSMPLRSNRFGLEPELTAKLAKRRCRIYEVPISYHRRTYGEGKKITWWDGVKALFVILYFWMVDDLYNEKYGHAILYRLSSTHRFNGWMASQVEPWLGDSVLEIGAGLGNLSTHLMPREHYTLSDVDPLHLQYLRNHFSSRPHTKVATVDLENHSDFRKLERNYESIVCLNVLEHVESDTTALRNLYRALNPGGRAIILVPRGMGLYGTLDRVLGHHRRYSQGELATKCEAAGFRIEKISTFNRVSVIPWFLNGRVLRRRHFGKLQVKIFDSTVWLWKRIDRLFPWCGLSLIVVARKPDRRKSARPKKRTAAR